MIKHWPMSVGAAVRKWILDNNSEEGDGDSAMLSMPSLLVVFDISDVDLGTILILTGESFSTCLFR